MAKPKTQLVTLDADLGALANLDHAIAVARQAAADAAENAIYSELGVEWDKTDTKIKLPGKPRQMTVPRAIETLKDFQAQADQDYRIQEFFPGMPHDAAHAFVQVLKSRYGWANAQTKQTMWGPEPPQMLTVRTGAGPDEFVEVPLGKFKLPDTKANVETQLAFNPANKRSGSFVSFVLSAVVKHEDRKIIQEIISETREYIATNSIYRGKAMRLPVTDSGSVESTVAPVFIDLSSVDPRGLVLTRVNEELLKTTVWTPIQHTDRLREMNITRKRGVLLYGPYGTGKTLTALVTAKLAIEHGWTFIMLDDPKGLAMALEMAKQYQPAVVFAEDIDRVVVKSRTDKANDILNTIDGALSKNAEVITVLTTNHIENINEAMLRPGRLDAVIEVTKPDAEAATRLVRLYAGNQLNAKTKLDKLGELIEGYIPAVIAEVVNRAKLAMIGRGDNEISSGDLELAAHSMQEHSKLLQPKEPEKSNAEKLGLAFVELLGTGTGGGYDGSQLESDIDSAKDAARDASQNAEAAYDIAERELPKIRKLLEAHADGGGTNGTGGASKVVLADISKKLDAIVKAAGVRVN